MEVKLCNYFKKVFAGGIFTTNKNQNNCLNLGGIKLHMAQNKFHAIHSLHPEKDLDKSCYDVLKSRGQPNGKHHQKQSYLTISLHSQE